MNDAYGQFNPVALKVTTLMFCALVLKKELNASVGQFNRSMTECPVLLITLLSSAGSQSSKGFILEYEARESSGSTKISPTSRQQITNADTGHIRYPGNGGRITQIARFPLLSSLHEIISTKLRKILL
ncbi:hypothetical protein Ocin01_18613 [Orchesella cincta]|uniref:Uncharacterized protein n=1 Tax=Orchesella cincta TaxID=48709 RepID=A0A1D2M517_ORCCI|nr:hypothetical protein Ocin01_18613 [Orchesella cincta]